MSSLNKCFFPWPIYFVICASLNFPLNDTPYADFHYSIVNDHFTKCMADVTYVSAADRTINYTMQYVEMPGLFKENVHDFIICVCPMIVLLSIIVVVVYVYVYVYVYILLYEKRNVLDNNNANETHLTGTLSFKLNDDAVDD